MPFNSDCTNNKARNLAKNLYTLYDMFLVDYNFLKESYSVNKWILARVCRSTMIDLEREADFHNITPHISKICGYLFHWFSKMRPITIIAHDKTACLEINERFIVQLVLTMLQVDIEKISEKEISQLVYFSTYRELGKKEFALVFYWLQKYSQCMSKSAIPQQPTT